MDELLSGFLQHGSVAIATSAAVAAVAPVAATAAVANVSVIIFHSTTLK